MSTHPQHNQSLGSQKNKPCLSQHKDIDWKQVGEEKKAQLASQKNTGIPGICERCLVMHAVLEQAATRVKMIVLSWEVINEVRHVTFWSQNLFRVTNSMSVTMIVYF